MKHLGLTLFLLIGFCFSNCSNHDDCGNFNSLPFFDIQSIEHLEHYRSSEDESELVIDSTSIQLSEYAGLSMLFGVDYIADSRYKESSLLFDFSLLNSLVACTPFPSGGNGSKEEKMEDLQIITMHDFDENHLAGSSLNDLMKINRNDLDIAVSELTSIDEYLLQNKLVESERFFLKPIKAPESSSDFQVKIMLELTGGEQYEIESSLIRIVN